MAIDSSTDMLRYYRELLFQRTTWDHVWSGIAELLSPHESEIRSRSMTGSVLTGQLYDSTGLDAWDKLSSAMSGLMFNSVVPTFTLTPRDEQLKTSPATLDWLEIVARDMFDEIRDSNFDRVGPGMMSSVSGFGTGGLGVLEAPPSMAPGTRGFRGLHHLPLAIGTYVIDENAWGDVDVLMRSYWMSARAVVAEWPNAPYSPTMKKMLDDKPEIWVQVVHGVVPNGRTSGARYDSWYVLAQIDGPMVAGEAGQVLTELEQGTFREFPFVVPRWYQAPGDVWGRGRGHLAFPEMRTANRARQLKLRAWAKTIDPPLKVLNRGVFGKVRLIPGAENVVRDMDAIDTMDFKIRFDHNAIPESESKLQIRQMFFTEQLLQFAVDRKTPPTATEVLQRMDFLHQLLGPAAGRVRTEGQTPYLKRVFNLKLRAGDFPPPPDELLAVGGVVDIEYLGPLARAQHNDELRGLTDTLSIVTTMAEVDPNVTDEYNLPMMARDLPRITGVSRRYLQDPDVVRQRQEARAQQQAQVEQQQAAQVTGRVAKDIGAAELAEAQAGGTP